MQLSKLIKKGDIFLIIILILLSVAGLFLLRQEPGDTVTVTQNGEVIYSGPLSQDKELVVSGEYENKIVIKGGKVYFAESNCPGHDCVLSGALDKSGQTAACLPNKTAIVISGGESEVDDIAK